MAMGRRCRESTRGKNSQESELIAFKAVRATRGLGRKRVGISNEDESCSDEFSSPLKRQCSNKFEDISPIEALPQELLIRVLCGVEHDDLKQLMLVSKFVMESALVAKRMHFAYSTPTKVKAFRTTFEMEGLEEEEEGTEAPNAPIRSRNARRRIGLKTKQDLAVSLFQSDDDLDEKWARRGGLSFMEEDVC